MDQRRIDLVPTALKSQIQGFRNIIDRRTRRARALVRAYNKSKHIHLALLTGAGEDMQVALLTSETGYTDPRGIGLAGQILRVQPSRIREYATWSLQTHMTLFAIQSMILETRYGEKLSTPRWFAAALELPGWATTRAANPET